MQTLKQRVVALETEHNEHFATIDRRFTNQQARAKLKKLYPVVRSQWD